MSASSTSNRDPSDAALTVCTIISKNYLAQARVLAESLARHHPEARFFVLLSDRVDGKFDPRAEPFTIIPIESLVIPDLPRFCFQYSILELNTAAKPYFLAHLFARHGARKLVYLDPDVMVLGSLAPLADLLDEHAIILTPHLTDVILGARPKAEINILRSGAYNLGFLALAQSPAALKLLDWWQQRLYTGCRVDPDHGLFVDQKWIDLVPGLFDGVFVLRDPGYNVAYWNLHGRAVTVRGDDVQVNGVPCRFFHFSGFDPAAPERVSVHDSRLAMKDIGDARQLFALYARRLEALGHREISLWPYSWAAFDNGEPISPAARIAYLELGDRAAGFGDPFAVAAETSFYRRRSPSRLAGPRPPAAASPLPFGVNVTGCFQSEKGIGEGSRAVVRALDAAGIPYVLNNLVDDRSTNGDHRELTFSPQNPYAINLVHVNADAVVSFYSTRGPEYFRGHKNVGFWNWELDRFPEMWKESFTPFDEIWTPSTSSQRSIAGASPIPVRCVPYSVEVPAAVPPGHSRAALGLPENAFLFVFAFDFDSFVERKNPMGAIRAFQRAFGKDNHVGLVVKTMHAGDDKQGWRALQAECAGWPNIHLMDRVLDRTGMHALVQLCDTFVSLHRAEGFGFLMAEAMAMGKPTLATAYSSNLDFMTPENSLLVRYRELAIDRDRGPYMRGSVWADPDVDHAAELMVDVVRDRERARRLGERARADIAREHSPARIGELIRRGLMELSARSLESSLTPLLWDLRVSADLLLSDGTSSRPVLGRAVERLRRLATRLLRPQLARQTLHNEILSRALALLNERLQEHEQALERLGHPRHPPQR